MHVEMQSQARGRIQEGHFRNPVWARSGLNRKNGKLGMKEDG